MLAIFSANENSASRIIRKLAVYQSEKVSKHLKILGNVSTASGMPDFSWSKIPKTVKNIPNYHKNTKRP
jgi:hypothetical protein